jgi:hypothetical protein
VTPLDQLRLRLPAHDFDRLMQAAKPVAESARDAMLRTSRRSLANTKWSGLACCIGSLAKCSGAMMSLTNAELRHKNGKTRDGCEGVGDGASARFIRAGQGRQATNSAASFTRAAAMTGALK